ncbi:MAG: hypothetical protein MMC33_008482 [Icmadophila ericetorum]|nr:hypothetical protein [Icmadophila ericetorum]
MPYTPPRRASEVGSSLSAWSTERGQQPNLGLTPAAQTESSISYMHKHRRSLAITGFTIPPPTPNPSPPEPDDSASNGQRTGNTISFPHLSLPPSNESSVILGAVSTPPASPQDLSIEGDNEKTSKTGQAQDIKTLRLAIKGMEKQWHGSLNWTDQDSDTMIQLGLGHLIPTAAVQKQSVSAHSISSSSQDPSQVSVQRSGSIDSIAGLHNLQLTSGIPDIKSMDRTNTKSPIARKKSGSLVRPALRSPLAARRASSEPGTPTFSKAVQFDSRLEHVRHFLQVDPPLTVSAGSASETEEDAYEGESCAATDEFSASSSEWEIRLANFPLDTVERRSLPVWVEQVFLSSDNTNLIGNTVVANLHFRKSLVVRFTLDYWETTSEVTAEYSRHVANSNFDRFSFSFNLDSFPNLESKTMLFCVRYRVDGKEFWDSNSNMNFQVNFSKKHLNLKNRRPDSHNIYTAVADTPNQRSNAMAQALSTRYSFGASLTAAIQAASDALDEDQIDHSSTSVRPRLKANQRSFSDSIISSTSQVNSHNPVPLKASTSVVAGPRTLTVETPSLRAQSYHELLDRYCFVGSSIRKYHWEIIR